MKLKTGPLLVIGGLILMVGLAVVLAPAPPPEHAEEKHQEPEKTSSKSNKTPPKFTLAQLKAGMAGADPKLPPEQALERLQDTIFGTRDAATRAPYIEYATQLAKSSPRESVRTNATGLLGSLPSSDPALFIGIAKTDKSPDVRRVAILSLGKSASNVAAQQALEQFINDPDPGLRTAAMISLTQLLSVSGKAGNEALVRLLGQMDNDASAQAAMKLNERNVNALPVLIPALYSAKSGPAREAAAMVIGLICSGYNPSIDEFARQAQVTHRQTSSHNAANLTGLQPLLWALKDSYAPTREVAAQGLGYLGDERAAKPLAVALKDPDAYVRRRAAAALITVPAKSVIAELSDAALKDTVPEVRRFAVEALGWVGNTTAVSALNEATKDKSPMVRRYAAVQLGKIADPVSLQALSNLLGDKGDPDADVRWAAVVALGKLKDKRAERALVECLADPSPQVANSAERALQRLGIARQEQAGFQS